MALECSEQPGAHRAEARHGYSGGTPTPESRLSYCETCLQQLAEQLSLTVLPFFVVLTQTPPLWPMATPLALTLDPPLLEEDDDDFPPAKAKLPPVATLALELFEDDDPAMAPPATIVSAAARMMIFFNVILPNSLFLRPSLPPP